MSFTEESHDHPDESTSRAHLAAGDDLSGSGAPRPGEKDRGPAPGPMLVSALAVAEAGLRVIPLKDRSKVPRLRAWQKNGTTDRKTIEGWFRQYPGSNLGICTGGGFIVLDVDPKNGGAEALAKLIEEHGALPPTAEVRTGSDGSHYFFRVEPDARIGNRVHFRPGLDIRGEGGQVVAPPSVHPETGREYRFVRHPAEGIAPAPAWLIDILAEEATPPTAKKARRPSGRPPGNGRKGDVPRLVEEMRRKFPIPGPGRRHGLMTRVVGSLVGQGYTDDLIIQVAMSWWEHYHAERRTTTGESGMLGELYACIESTRANKSFRASTSGIDHRAMCRSIVITPEQEAWLRARVVADEHGGKTLLLDQQTESRRHLSTCRRGTQTSRIKDRLCIGDDERFFVLALIVHVTHKRINTHEGREGIVRMTHGQLREIIQDRHPRGQEWRGDNKQIGRLKRRYVSQPGRPAERFEMIRETYKGKPGVPSEYLPTGIEFFLNMAEATPAEKTAAA
jgi:Bifunctional DNA primase/polymerase, N-terminal